MLDHSTQLVLDNGDGIPAAVLAVLAVLLVVLGTYGRRLCRHHAVRFLVLYIFVFLSSALVWRLEAAKSKCESSDALPTGWHNRDVFLWLLLILIVKSNSNIDAKQVTAAGSSREEVGTGATENLAVYAWLAFVIWPCVPPVAGWLGHPNGAVFFLFSALGLKLALKQAAFYGALGSFVLGRNAHFISFYMDQLADDGENGGREQVPRYVVMGEKKEHVEVGPRDFRVKRDALQDKSSGLVTLDRVWRLADAEAERGDGILAETVELRDLCLSYSLFKIPLALAAGSRSSEALSFVLSLRGMGSAGMVNADADRVFRVLADELWFASDYLYDSPIPSCILGGWCAALDYICSLLIIAAAVAVGCFGQPMSYKVITYSLLLTVVLFEAMEIVAGVCSNWTKMALLGHYMRHQSMWVWRRSSCVHAALTAVLRLRAARRWPDKLGQNSLLEPRRCWLTSLLWERLYGSSGLKKSIRVLPSVRDAVLRSLVSSYGGGGASKDSAAARRVVGGKLADRSGSSTELILVWHVATRLFEMKSTTSASASSPDMIAACHLSNYCAYLLAVAPELLLNSASWAKRRYKQVSDDVRASLGADGGVDSTSAAQRYERLLAELSKDSRDPVLRRGAELGRHLVEEYDDDEASAWRILADFWSDMLLFEAPSSNAEGHVQAMARGGEFITLVWALLLHAGVTTRPQNTPGGDIRNHGT